MATLTDSECVSISRREKKMIIYLSVALRACERTLSIVCDGAGCVPTEPEMGDAGCLWSSTHGAECYDGASPWALDQDVLR